jgi:hypothetical protein
MDEMKVTLWPPYGHQLSYKVAHTLAAKGLMYNHYPCFKWSVRNGEEEEKRREKPDLNNATKRIRLTKKFQSQLWQ